MQRKTGVPSCTTTIAVDRQWAIGAEKIIHGPSLSNMVFLVTFVVYFVVYFA